ncbi:unnamed protein product [Allacma fusca]|uniref:Tetratricopeptide repeat protein 7 N-terminal domain-containing protein n=1 Tax=Allacma fusca TaxID=39272 RepID=A0A8J2JE40_9HEXA|nr:unnamed protein product [Allacma fusca]
MSNTSPDALMNFLYAEAKLEIWLDEHQPAEKHITKAKSALLDIKKSILLCLNQSNDQSGLKTDALVLLAKVYFASGLYEEALEELNKSGFENIDHPAHTVRNLQLMAEAYSVKGFCLEKVGRSWRGSSSLTEVARKEEILRCYHKAADLAIAYFQNQEKYAANLASVNSTTTTVSQSPHPPTYDKKRPNSLIDYAIRRGPVILLEDNQTDEAVKRLQWLLRSCETNAFSSIRLLLYRRLAEVLLRYRWFPSSAPAMDSLSKAKHYAGASIFTPHNLWEDVFLVLLLSEAVVVRDGVLNQAPEFAKARKLANLNAAAVFDLLTVAAGRWGKFSVLNECFDRALKFSFEEPHVWSQYALTFQAGNINSRKSTHTILEAAKLSKKPTSLLLLGAQQLFSRYEVQEGLDLVAKAKEKELAGAQKMLQRVCLYEGIGTFLLSFEKHMHQQRLHDLDTAIAVLQSASDMDPMDHLTLHWLGRVHAWSRNLQDGFAFSVRALRAFPFHLPTLQLIILLLSAQRNYPDALSVTEEALDEYPDHLGLLQMKAALEEVVLGPEAALLTLKQMLMIWKNLFDDGITMRSDSPDSRAPGGTLHLPSPTDRETVSVASFRAPSMAGSSTNTGTLNAGFRADAALSEIASSISMHGSLAQSGTGELAWAAQINIWVMLAELYLKLDKPDQALSSIEEAAQIAAAHQDVLYVRGQIAEYHEDFAEARVFYESAVAVRPTHSKALQSLALMQHYFGSHRLAEKTLQDALRLDPYDHHTWYKLGKVLEALGECAEAGDCMATALDIEAISPVLPYSVIPVCFD